MASSVVTAKISSTSLGFHRGGIKPMPIPSILCEPEGLPEGPLIQPAPLQKNAQLWVATPQRVGRSVNGVRRAHRVHKGVDAVARLLPDLLTERLITAFAVPIVTGQFARVFAFGKGSAAIGRCRPRENAQL